MLRESGLIELVLQIDEIKKEFHYQRVGSSKLSDTKIIYDRDSFINWKNELQKTLRFLGEYYDDDIIYEAELAANRTFNGLNDEYDFWYIEVCLKNLLNSLPLNNTSKNKEEEKMERKNVFIVHGHDNEAKETVARVLEKLGYNPIILHEQASAGMTIIEKIESYSDEVVFSIILYTECDLGRDKNDSEDKNRYRARQNVVFEHGFLTGKFGRDRILALVKGNVETPGDLSGIVYTPMDQGGAWKFDLIKNMKHIGLNVSADLL